MSIFFKARGSNSIGIFFVRMFLGTYIFVLGIKQAGNIEAYITKVKAFNLLNENLSFIIGFVTPFLLILFGALYVMGFFTPATSFVLAVISFLKVCMVGFIVSGGIPFNKDLIFFACFVCTFFTGAGMLSFDAMLDRKKVQKKLVDSPNKVTAEVVVESSESSPTDSSPTENQS